MTLRRLFHALAAPTILACTIALSSTPAAAAEAPNTIGPCPDGALAPDAQNLSRIEASVLCLLNEERGRAGLSPLSLNTQLERASQPFADRMVAQQFFSHESPDGATVVDRIRPTGYLPSSDIWVVGENLAWGSGTLSTPQAIVNGWMNSPDHRANVLATDYRDIGLGVALGSPRAGYAGGTTYVTDFGQRTASPPRRLTVSVSQNVTSTAKHALARGVTFRVGCSRACSLVGRLFLHITRAQAAGLRAAPPLAGSLRLSKAGHGTFRVQLSAGAKHALRRLKRMNMTLVTKASGTGITRLTRVTLR